MLSPTLSMAIVVIVNVALLGVAQVVTDGIALLPVLIVLTMGTALAHAHIRQQTQLKQDHS